MRHGFVSWDDGEYVADNPAVRAGLTPRGAAWAFTTDTAANWHPLTWLSHMLDVRLFGLDPGGHHLTSVLLHAANAVLLFHLLRSATGRPWPAALAAALFAAHPLHVESVAWVAERKDVLAGLSWALVSLAHLRFARRPGAGRRLAVVALYALGLMAKPTLVTLPLVLLLLDWWPLGRLGRGAGRAGVGRLALEKAPLLLLAAASSAVTWLVQARGAAVTGLEVVPLGARLANAATSCVAYLAQTAIPVGLSFLYPYPRGGTPVGPAIAAAALLALATLLALRARARRPWLLVGWLWYLVALLPVLGVVQVGVQARADRYTYLPLTGVFLLLAWSLPGAAAGTGGGGARRGAAAVGTLAAVGVLAVAARAQVGHWRDDLALFGHAVAVDPGNWVAQNNLGKALALRGRIAEAVPHFAAAARANPGYAAAWYNLGVAAAGEGRLPEAAGHFRQALAARADYPEALGGLGSSLLRQGLPREALEPLEAALRLDPRDPVTSYNLGSAWSALGDQARAEEHFREALRLKPGYGPAATGLEIARRRGGSHP